MSFVRTFALAASALLLFGPPGAARSLGDDPAKVSLQWNRDEYACGELPDELSGDARKTIETWARWAAGAEYRMELTADQRVLLLVHEREKKAKKQLELIAETAAEIDALTPVPAARHAVETGGAGGSSKAKPKGTWEYSWGDPPPLETRTCVLLELRSPKDYPPLLQFIGKEYPHLTGWTSVAGKQYGFVLEDPLVGCWVYNAPGQEEWKGENELVNRLAQLLFMRAYGSMPYWFTMGLAWYVETELLDEIYCFPNRSDFIFSTEHSSWERDLKNTFKDRKDEPFRMMEVADWQRGVYDAHAARTSWGLVTFLARHHADALPEIAEALRLAKEEHEIVRHDDGTWERVAGYLLPGQLQAEILDARIEGDFLTEAHEAMAKGAGYKKPKPKKD